MVEDLSELLIQEFEFWDLYLHPNQDPYVGYCVALAKRRDVTSTVVIGPELSEEVGTIVPPLRAALKELYHPNLFYSYNTHENGLLFAHFFPRYNSSREVHGQTFIDTEFMNHTPSGRSFPPTTQKPHPSIEFLLKIKEELLTQMGLTDTLPLRVPNPPVPEQL